MLFNIGLASGDRVIASAQALRQTTAHFGPPTAWGVVDSDSEPTLVAFFDGFDSQPDEAPTAWLIDRLAKKLGQECIAAWGGPVGQEAGALIGPKAAAWGAFNPALFFTLDGTRLAQAIELRDAA